MAKSLTLPLFPLHSVLFPGGALELRIFEPRYLDMVSRCLKEESGMGICLIRSGTEVGEAAEVYSLGTLGRINYWHKRPDGLLGMTVLGEQRFRIIRQWVEPDQLRVAEVELLPADPPQAIPDELRGLAEMLHRIMTDMGPPYIKLDKHYDDAGWVSARLAELLPLEGDHKQHLLQEYDPLSRLRRLHALLGE